MELSIHGAGGTVVVSDAAFARDFNEPLVHQVVTAYQAAGRQGTRAQLTRSEVRGGGKKPWKQKGGGRARAGTTRGPLWRGGGVTFAAQTQNHAQKVNKKMYRAAMQSILSELIRLGRLMVVEELSVSAPKTKVFRAKMKDLGLESALIVSESIDKTLYLASRNVPHVNVCDVQGIDPLSLISYETVLVTVPALKKIEEMLG